MKWLIVVVWLFAGVTYADEIASWFNALEHPRYDSLRLTEANHIAEYQSKDLSPLLMPHTEFLGFIGDDYQRLRITITSISRTPQANLYRVVGSTRVRNNANTFEGKITIKQIREYETKHYGIDDEFKNAGIRAQGIVVGAFTFREPPSKPHSGKFEGVVTALWLEDKDGNLRYDDIEASFSDNYINNQYVGVWQSYTTGAKKVANWGEHRIPFSGDLDIGAAEFGANPKYWRNGWASDAP